MTLTVIFTPVPSKFNTTKATSLQYFSLIRLNSPTHLHISVPKLKNFKCNNKNSIIMYQESSPTIHLRVDGCDEWGLQFFLLAISLYCVRNV